MPTGKAREARAGLCGVCVQLGSPHVSEPGRSAGTLRLQFWNLSMASSLPELHKALATLPFPRMVPMPACPACAAEQGVGQPGLLETPAEVGLGLPEQGRPCWEAAGSAFSSRF